MKRHNKLVRKNIPGICKANGQQAHFHVIEDDGEYLDALFRKDVEETDELKDAIAEEDPEIRRASILGELADKSEVLIATAEALGFTPAEVEVARLQKLNERGGFGERIFLEFTE